MIARPFIKYCCECERRWWRLRRASDCRATRHAHYSIFPQFRKPWGW